VQGTYFVEDNIIHTQLIDKHEKTVEWYILEHIKHHYSMCKCRLQRSFNPEWNSIIIYFMCFFILFFYKIGESPNKKT